MTRLVLPVALKDLVWAALTRIERDHSLARLDPTFHYSKDEGQMEVTVRDIPTNAPEGDETDV